ncbi:MAG TPA: isochorismatase family cysteine hydrolase [Xanthobacteraceae bacterium]
MTPTSNELLVTLEQKISPDKAALLVIDVQNDFVADKGFFAGVGADVGVIQRRTIPPLLRLIDAARAAGVLVVFVQAIYDPQDLSPAMRERNLRTGRDTPRCLTGSWGADFFSVRPTQDDVVVIKHRYSAMINTGLNELLKERGIESLLLTGVSTDTCVESTGRDAYFMDYYVTMVSDCCGAVSDADHSGALARFDRDYGAIVTSDEVINSWAALGAGARRKIA